MACIVVGYASSPEGRAALTRATAEAKARGARLVVVDSDRGRRDAAQPAGGGVQLSGHLQSVREELDRAEVDSEIRQLVEGMDAAEDLINVAEEVAADLVVIGLRRRRPVGKLILGSNAQRVLLDASCPVLAVKPD